MRAILLLCLLLGGCREPDGARLEQVRRALGLEGIIMYDFNAIHMGEGLSAFCMPHYYSREDPRDLRQEALDKLRVTPGWHVEPVDAAQVTALMRANCPGATLFPKEGTTFQAWFCEQDGIYPETLPREMSGASWKLGFFSADDGWWLYMDDKGYDLGNDVQMQQAGPIAITAAYQPADDGLWNEGEITREELVSLMERTQEEAWPRMYPAAGIVFDLWHWEDRSGGKNFAWNGEAFPQTLQNASIQDSRDWVLTLYDEETGLQITYEYKG